MANSLVPIVFGILVLAYVLGAVTGWICKQCDQKPRYYSTRGDHGRFIKRESSGDKSPGDLGE